MEENSNVYRTKSENEEVRQPDGAEQSSVYGQQRNTPSFAEIVQQGPANYKSPSVAQQTGTDPQPPFGGQPNLGQQGTASPQPLFGGQPNLGQQGTASPQQPFGGQSNFGGQVNPQQPNFGGQPNPVQSPYYQQPNPGLQYEKPKKGKTVGIVIAIIAVLVVLAGGIGAFMLLRGGAFKSKDPEKMLQQALEIQQKESEAYTVSLDELLGMTAIQERQEKEPYHTDISLSFTLPFSYDLDNISIGLDAITDKSNKQGEYELSVGSYGFKMSVGSVVMADNIMYFSVPLILHDTYHIDLENIEEDIKNSPWVAETAPELLEEFSVEMFENATDEEAMQAELKELIEKYITLLAENREIALLSEPKEFTLHGRTEKCSGVSITIGKDKMNEWLEGFKTEFMDTNYYKYLINAVGTDLELDGTDYEEYRQEADEFVEALFGMHFEQDYVINVYMDSKGRIINESTPEDIHVSNSEIELFSVDINYLGDERALDTIDCFCYFKTADASYYFGLDRNAEVSDEVYKENWKLSFGEVDGAELSFAYKNDWSYSGKEFDMEIALRVKDEYGYTEDFTITAEGAFTGIVAGDSYTLEIDNATLDYDNETLVIMSGKIISEFTNKVIEVPKTSINIFDLTEEEIEDLLFGSSSSLYY